MEPTVVGIDLGTTHSLVAFFENGRVRTIPNALGEILTPSAVSVDGDRLLVGAAAKLRELSHPDLTATGFKRDMGLAKSWRLGGFDLSPIELSSFILMALAEDARVALGRPIDEAVITVPAYFDEGQRRATKEAARLAGLHVERLVNEPTAAALAYGLQEPGAEEKKIAVLDLGGGTFDVTLLNIVDGVIEVLSSAGDIRLGGDDFTHLLAAHLAEAAGRKRGHDFGPGQPAWPRMVLAAERAKKELSWKLETTLCFEALPGTNAADVTVQLELNRVEVEQIWEGLIQRCRQPVARALRDAGLRPADIGRVVLAGGATRMPAFVRLARQIFTQEPLARLPVDEIVVWGAAIQAALKVGDRALDELVVTDIAPFSLGVKAASNRGQSRLEDIFVPILERGTVLPASRSERFRTLSLGQSMIEVEVFQGEYPLCSRNTALGSLTVTDLPVNWLDYEAVDIRFTYDLNALLEIEVTVVSTGARSALIIEQSPGRLDSEELAQALERLARLKLHPREEQKNILLVAAAEALYVELRGPARHRLSEALQNFLLSLDEQDPSLIDKARALLESILDELRS